MLMVRLPKKLDYINSLLLKAYPLKFLFRSTNRSSYFKKEEYDGLFSSSQEYDPNFDWGMNFGGGFKTDSGMLRCTVSRSWRFV
jgi:hypothetical protein